MTKCICNTIKYFLLNLIFRLNNFFRLFLRLWKFLFIDLLVLIERYFINLHCNSRNHIRWLCFFYKVIKGIYINLAVRYNVCSDILSTCWFIKRNYCCIFYAFISSYDFFNLRKLYSKTSDFNLSIFSAYYLNISVRKISCNIS